MLKTVSKQILNSTRTHQEQEFKKLSVPELDAFLMKKLILAYKRKMNLSNRQVNILLRRYHIIK